MLFLKTKSLVYIETSAATAENVEKALDILLEKVMIRMEKTLDKTLFPIRSITLPEDEANNNNNSCWC